MKNQKIALAKQKLPWGQETIEILLNLSSRGMTGVEILVLPTLAV